MIYNAKHEFQYMYKCVVKLFSISDKFVLSDTLTYPTLPRSRFCRLTGVIYILLLDFYCFSFRDAFINSETKSRNKPIILPK